jgi:hypothetical protein
MRRGLDGRDDLARDAQLREGPERGLQVGVVVADRLVEADHAFLDDVLAVRADEEVGARLGAGEAAVFLEQLTQSAVVAVTGGSHQGIVAVGSTGGLGAGCIGSAEPSGTHRFRTSGGS